MDFLLEVRPEVSNRLAIAQDDSLSLQEFRIARDQRGSVRRFPHGPTEQASRILSEQPLDGRDVVARRPSESEAARMRALSRHGPIGSIERGEVDVPHLLVDPVPADVPTRREGGEPQSFAQEPFMSPLHRRPRESLAPPRWMGTDARDRADRLLARPKADPHVEGDHLRHDLSVFDRVEGEPVEAPRVDSADLPDSVLGEIPAGGRHAELPHGPRVDLIVRHDSHRSPPRIVALDPRGEGDLNPRAQAHWILADGISSLAIQRPTRLGDPRRPRPSRTDYKRFLRRCGSESLCTSSSVAPLRGDRSDDEVAARNSAASRLPTAARDPRRPSVRQPDGGELLARLSREPAAVPLLRRFDLRLDHRVRRGGVHRPRTRARSPDSRHDRHVDGPGDHGPRTHFVRGPSRPPGDGIRRLVLRDLHTPLLAPAQLADRARDPFGEPRGTPRGDHRRLRDHGSPRADPRRVLGGPGELPGRLRPRRGHRRRELPSRPKSCPGRRNALLLPGLAARRSPDGPRILGPGRGRRPDIRRDAPRGFPLHERLPRPRIALRPLLPRRRNRHGGPRLDVRSGPGPDAVPPPRAAALRAGLPPRVLREGPCDVRLRHRMVLDDFRSRAFLHLYDLGRPGGTTRPLSDRDPRTDPEHEPDGRPPRRARSARVARRRLHALPARRRRDPPGSPREMRRPTPFLSRVAYSARGRRRRDPNHEGAPRLAE